MVTPNLKGIVMPRHRITKDSQSIPLVLGGPWTLRGARKILDNSENHKPEKVIRAIKMVGDGEKRNEEDAERLTAAMFEAVPPRRIKVVEALLNNGVDVDIQLNKGVTALMVAAVSAPEIVEALLNKGADVNIKDVNSVTALMLAVSANVLNRNTKIIEALLAKGADVNIKANDGRTALGTAKQVGNQYVIEILLKAGAKEGNEIASPSSTSAADETKVEEFFDAVLAGDTSKVQVLLKQGIDMKSSTKALGLAAASGKTEISEVLLNEGADVNSQDEEGLTPLIAAAFNNLVEIVEILLRNGADIDAQEEKGWTALYAAALTNSVGAVDILIKNGAEVNIKTNDGETALDIAQELWSHRNDVIEILLEVGAKEGKNISPDSDATL